MARVTTTLLPRIITFPFKTGDAAPSIGLKPSAAITASLVGSAIALTGAGDNQAAIVDFFLPANFSYVMTDLMAKINVVAAPNLWDDLALFTYNDQPAPNTAIEWAAEMATSGASSAGTVEVKVYAPTGLLPTFQMIPPVGGSVAARVQVFFENSTDQEPAAALSFTARFLQYTVNQAYDIDVNTPILIR